MPKGILVESSPHIKRTSWFFGIGINAYKEFPRLYNAAKDVRDIQAVLMERFDVEEDHCFTVFNENASEERIVGILSELSNKVGTEDKLLIYYSGHGYLEKGRVGYWIPHDGKPGNSSRYIANSTIYDKLGLIDAKHILLVSDSCFSGSLFTPGAMRSSRSAEVLDRYNSRWALCSGRKDEEVSDGLPGTNSPFAKSVLRTLSEINEGLTAAKLIQSVQDYMASDIGQLPLGGPMKLNAHDNGQYVFKLKDEHVTTRSRDVVEGSSAVGSSSTTGTFTRQSSVSKNDDQLSDGEMGKIMKWMFAIFALVGLTVFGIFWMVTRMGDGTSSVPQLFMTLDVNDESVRVLPSGGVPIEREGQIVFDVEVRQANDAIVYQSDISMKGGLVPFEVIGDRPQDYMITIRDQNRSSVSKSFSIPNGYETPSLVRAFHTASSLNEETIWPGNTVSTFKTGEPVYVYGTVESRKKRTMQINWTEGRSSLHTRVIIVHADTGDGTRLWDKRTFDRPGSYTVRLIPMENEGVEIARAEFVVR